jgi:polyphosphate kinase
MSASPAIDLATVSSTSSEFYLYLNRELSWINFNDRVLKEAENPHTPVLEKVKFLAIANANTDEFYMKRIGWMTMQISHGNQQVTADGRSIVQQLNECRQKLAAVHKAKESIYHSLVQELDGEGIRICTYSALDTKDQQALREHYIRNILPLVTPLAIDLSHPFPFISNLSLNLLFSLQRANDLDVLQVRVKVPLGDGLPRFIPVGSSGQFVRLEELIIENSDLLFPNTQIMACDLFRITRNAIVDRGEPGGESKKELIQTEIHNRKFSPVVRLQINTSMNQNLRKTLIDKLDLNSDEDVVECDKILQMADLMELATMEIPSLRDRSHSPINNITLCSRQSIFSTIRNAGSILLQHPYESFATSVERFVIEASEDPQVASIKMTLYRTSANTRIIQSLIDAAHRGKQVAVVIELSARFDEAANIQWANHLQMAGIHVNYGVADLKTHCKTILVVRREEDGLRHYAHVGTGNYHAGTAKIYSDIGLLTCNSELTRDLTELFNYLTTGCHPQRQYRHILVAPLTIKIQLLAKIRREISQHSKSTPGLIRLKTNALEDPDITAALYQASQAGVTVELIVRDICRLRPGVPLISENIRVISILGRFLEHSRIYHFRNAGHDEYYIGSADLMTRNLERRVEVLVPLEDSHSQQLLAEIIDTQLNDESAWHLQSNGCYVQRSNPAEECMHSSQELSIRRAWQRQENMTKNNRHGKRSSPVQWASKHCAQTLFLSGSQHVFSHGRLTAVHHGRDDSEAERTPAQRQSK